MKLRMLSLLSVILALTIKSLEISAKDYHQLRVFAHAIPSTPSITPYDLTTELDSVVHQLALANSIKEIYVGIDDSITGEFKAYEKLKMIATEQELNNLLLHDSPIVKVYAYRALVVNEMNMDCDVELALLSDTTCIDWYSEDVLTNTTVKEMVQRPYYK